MVERTVDALPFPLTNPDRVVFPAHGDQPPFTKAHVVGYYAAVADVMLPHVRGRPLVFRRYPRGIADDFFYTKDWSDQALPEVVTPVDVYSVSRGEPMRYVMANHPHALPWCAQMGAVEVHPWLASTQRHPPGCGTEPGLRNLARCGLDHPDIMAFDVDPYVRAGREGARGTEAGGEPGLDPQDWAQAVRVAHVVREVLDDVGLPSFVKTSGKRGLHVLVPLEPELTHDGVRAFATTIAQHVVRSHRDDVTLAYAFAERKGRVFLDVNQNVRGKTLAAPYSLRPTPQATVSMPLAWRDLDDADPAAHALPTVPDHVARRGDPWRGLFEAAVRLSEVVGRAPSA